MQLKALAHELPTVDRLQREQCLRRVWSCLELIPLTGDPAKVGECCCDWS